MSTQSTSAIGYSISRREFVVSGAATIAAPRLALAEDFPSKPIRIVLGTTPGASIDTVARLVAAAIAPLLNTTVVVENKPGASGMIAAEAVMSSPADGYTLLMGTPSGIIIAPQAMTTVKFKPLEDVVGVNIVSTSPIGIAINPSLDAKNIQELTAQSKKSPITMGLPLVGSASHLVVEMVRKVTGCNFQNVPYKGGAPAMNDAIAGHVNSTVSDVGVLAPMHKAGKLRLVLVSSDKRLPELPDVPAAGETAAALVATNWMGVFAHAKTPKPVLEKISAALAKGVNDEGVRAQLAKYLATATSMASPDEFQKFVVSEYHRYGELVREAGIKIN